MLYVVSIIFSCKCDRITNTSDGAGLVCGVSVKFVLQSGEWRCWSSGAGPVLVRLSPWIIADQFWNYKMQNYFTDF